MSEVKEETKNSKTFHDLDVSQVLEGAKVVESKRQIPINENVVYLNPGHSAKIPIDLVDDKGNIYFVKTKMSTGGTTNAIHLAIDIDNLIKNRLFKNPDTKEQVLDYFSQQMGQKSHAAWTNAVKPILRSLEEKPDEKLRKLYDEKLESIRHSLREDYYQAKAAKKLLEKLGKFKSPSKDKLEANANSILSGGTLEEQLQKTKEELEIN